MNDEPQNEPAAPEAAQPDTIEQALKETPQEFVSKMTETSAVHPLPEEARKHAEEAIAFGKPPVPPKKPKKKKETKADRLQAAAQEVLDAVEEARADVGNLSAAYSAAVEAYNEAQEALQGAIDNVEEKLEELKSVREDEYQGWYDNMTEGLQQTPTGQKLEELLNIDLDISMPELEEMPEFEEPSFDDIESAAQEIMDAEYPLGFGKD